VCVFVCDSCYFSCVRINDDDMLRVVNGDVNYDKHVKLRD